MLCNLFCVYVNSLLKLEHWSDEYIEHREARYMFGDMNSFFKVKSQCLVFAHSLVHVVRSGLKRFCRGLSSMARKHYCPTALCKSHLQKGKEQFSQKLYWWQFTFTLVVLPHLPHLSLPPALPHDHPLHKNPAL